MAIGLLEVLSAIDGKLPAIDDGTLRLSYADVQRSVASERRWLQSMGVRRCALLAENSARWVLSDLALLACEAMTVPLPASFNREQTEHVLHDADVEWILTDAGERVTREHPAFNYVATSHRTGLSLLRREVSPNPTNSLATHIVKVTYTAGVRKGVCLRHGSIQAVTDSLVAATAGLGVQTHLCVLPLTNLLENIAGVYVPLTMGAKVVVRPSHTMGVSEGGLNVSLLLRAIDSTSPESMILGPELLLALVHAVEGGWRPPVSLKLITVGGAVSTSLLTQARQAGLPAFQGYGLSECASMVCLNTPRQDKPGSVGRPLPHARVRIDANGEICVSGATMVGYLGEPLQRNSEVRTGDLGAIDADGFVYVRGRMTSPM